MKASKPLLALVILLVLVFMHGQARAEWFFYTGKKLVEAIYEYDKYIIGKRDVQTNHVNFLRGYVAGVADGKGHVREDITIDQICAIVSRYLKNHHERWGESAATLVVDALTEAFPMKAHQGGMNK